MTIQRQLSREIKADLLLFA